MHAQDIYADAGDRDMFMKAIEEKGEVRDFEVKLRKKDGWRIDCLITATVTRTDDGSTSGYQGVIRDITEKKRQEEHSPP